MDLLQTLKLKCINKTTTERSNSLTDFATATVGNKQMYMHVIPFKVWGQSVWYNIAWIRLSVDGCSVQNLVIGFMDIDIFT